MWHCANSDGALERPEKQREHGRSVTTAIAGSTPLLHGRMDSMFPRIYGSDDNTFGIDYNFGPANTEQVFTKKILSKNWRM